MSGRSISSRRGAVIGGIAEFSKPLASDGEQWVMLAAISQWVIFSQVFR